MLIALCTGLLMPKHIDTAAHFLVSILPFLLVAPAVNILRYWGFIKSNLAAIAGFDLQPAAKALKAVFNIAQLPDKAAPEINPAVLNLTELFL